jgi:CheY-like chemotaxis protein
MQTETAALKILLADDDVDDRDLFKEAVSMINPEINVTAVEDGEQLMDELLQQKTLPDVIFLDLNMPRKNGKECLQEIKQHHHLQHVPVLIYTTSVNKKDVDETYAFGAKYFIRKPNSFGELKSILHNVLRMDLNHPDNRKDQFLISPAS